MHARSLLERARFSVVNPMTYDTDKAHSIRAISRSLIPLLSVLPLEGFHLSVSAVPASTVSLPDLGIPFHRVGGGAGMADDPGEGDIVG